MGGQLAAAGSAADTKQGLATVRKIMQNEGLNATDINSHAQEIYEAIRAFIDNTDFSVSFRKPY